MVDIEGYGGQGQFPFGHGRRGAHYPDARVIDYNKFNSRFLGEKI
jgi:hypothetical protein